MLSCGWLQTEHGLNVIVEMLANVNLDKDFELAGLMGRIAVSQFFLNVSSIFSVSKSATFSQKR